MGGNDMLQQVDARITEQNLRSMIGMAQAHGAAVVLIGVPTPRLLSEVAPFYHKVADAQGIPLEADALLSVLRRNAYKSDPIHPNADGYRVLAQAVAELLRRAGAV